MHKFIYNKMMAPNDGAGGGSASPSPAPAPAPAVDPNKPKTKEEMLATFNNFWNPPEPKTPTGNPSPSPTPAPAPGVPTDRLKEFLKNQDYFAGFDKHKFTEAMRSGNPDEIMPFFQQMMSNSMEISLANMNKFGEYYYNKAKEEAGKDFGEAYKMDKAYNALFSEKPELKLPAISPMAKATLKHALSKTNGDIEQAVKMTVELFSAMGGNPASAPPNLNNNPGGPPIGYTMNNGEDKKAIDYDALWKD